MPNCHHMNYFSITFALLLFVLSNSIMAQTTVPKELIEMNKGQFKTYHSDGSGRAAGLRFSVAYPNSYQQMPEDLSGVVVGFAKSIVDAGNFRVGINKLPKGWDEAFARKLGISKEQARVYLISEKFLREEFSDEQGQLFFYKDGFKLAGENAAVFDYVSRMKVNWGDKVVDFVSYSRVYVFYYLDYEIKLLFARAGFASDEKKIKMEFNNYKEFYSFIAYTFNPEVK